MTLRQLRYLQSIAQQSMNISNAAAALHKSQPGVGRQIRMLEAELGAQLLIRRKNRVLGLTAVGKSIVEAANRALDEVDRIRTMAKESCTGRTGKLSIATGHLHARYTLLTPVRELIRRDPELQLHIRHADADDVPKLVEAGKADIGIGTAIAHEHPSLAVISCDVIRRSLIMPLGHPLSKKRGLSLADIAAYPIVGYDEKSRSEALIAETFRLHGLQPRFVAIASDSDIIKSYVEEGLGVAVVATIALDRSCRVHRADVSNLFPKTTMTLCLRRDLYLRRCVIDLIQLIAPRVTIRTLQRAVGVVDV